ncbi:hypothetical protein MRX96_018497 [Rhipicephalus microplus]
MVRGLLAVLLLCASLVLGEEQTKPTDTVITHVRVEVKRFVYDDIPEYPNAEFKVIHGAKPEILFLNAAGEEVERLSLEQRSRDECNQLLTDRGFVRKVKEPEEEEEDLGIKGEL